MSTGRRGTAGGRGGVTLIGRMRICDDGDGWETCNDEEGWGVSEYTGECDDVEGRKRNIDSDVYVGSMRREEEEDQTEGCGVCVRVCVCVTRGCGSSGQRRRHCLISSGKQISCRRGFTRHSEWDLIPCALIYFISRVIKINEDYMRDQEKKSSLRNQKKKKWG